MKKYLNILIISVLVFGCKEEWLTLYPTDRIADDQAIQSVTDGRAAMLGVYARMRDYQIFGRNMFVCSDAGCEDVVLRTDNSNRYVVQYRWKLQTGDTPTTEMWQYTYNAIKRANEVITRLAAVTPAGDETEEAKDQIIGEAYFTRAFLHYELVKFYAHAYNYTSDASHPGIPYIEESTMENDHARNTVKECFEKIIADADEAIRLMNIDKPSVPYYAGSLAVKSLLARVYLYMAGTANAEYYTKAAQYAEEVISSNKYTIVSADDYQITGSNTAFTSAKMWGADYSTESIFVLPYTSTERLYTNSLPNIYLDKNKGYGDLKPSEDILELVGYGVSDDCRATLFYLHDGAMCVRKFWGAGGVSWDLANVNLFRLSEMYLIAAEGNAKGSPANDAKAAGFLNTLKTNRGLTAVSLTGQGLVNEILRERRKELCFEGHSLPDHKRLNTSIERTADKTNPENQNLGLTYPNDYFALPIPTSEINTNKLIEQNPGY